MESREQRLQALRVAQSELCSGDVSGNVYTQVSPGAAMFLTSREVAINDVTKRIRDIVQAQPAQTPQETPEGTATTTTRSSR